MREFVRSTHKKAARLVSEEYKKAARGSASSDGLEVRSGIRASSLSMNECARLKEINLRYTHSDTLTQIQTHTHTHSHSHIDPVPWALVKSVS